MIYTFYSYKGGVGRSMALANVAEWFYRQGLRVIVIDWDLEAPGLENFFITSEKELDAARSQLGLIDVLLAYKRLFPRLMSPQANDDKTQEEEEKRTWLEVLRSSKALSPISDVLYPIHAADSNNGDDAALLLMSAGWRSGDRFPAYAQAVQSFDWTDFYNSYQGEAYFDWMREQLVAPSLSDVVLIDSRTGVTEMGGVCTRQMADIVVSFCVPNAQNLAGVHTMAVSFARKEIIEKRGRELDLILVPTRIDMNELTDRDLFGMKFRQKLDEFTPSTFKAVKSTFWDLQIPYIPKYAYSEKLAINETIAPELNNAYRKLAAHLALLAEGKSSLKIRTAMADELEQEFRGRLPSVFISYVDSEGKEIASELRKRLSDQRVALWPELTDMKVKGDVWRQITDILDQAKAMVLIITPEAVHSENARRQWRYARQQGVSVYLVARSTASENLFRESVPSYNADRTTTFAQDTSASRPYWLRNQDYFDPDTEWERLASVLQRPVTTTRVPFMTPELLEGYVARPEILSELKHALLDAEPGGTVALCGPAGCGKTTSAAGLCYDEDINSFFEDGIMWVTLGENPNILGELMKLYAALKGERPPFVDAEEAARALSEKLSHKHCLLVISDALSLEHLRYFALPPDSRCVRLITLRDAGIAVGLGVDPVIMPEMSESEALELISAQLETRHADESMLRELTEKVGKWPLALKLVNAELRKRLSQSHDQAVASKSLLEDLDHAGVLVLDKTSSAEGKNLISQKLEAAIAQALPVKEDYDRYIQLAFFPNDDIALKSVSDLWGLDLAETETRVQELKDLSLLEYEPSTKTIRLHTVMRSYLLSRMPDQEGLNDNLEAAFAHFSREQQLAAKRVLTRLVRLTTADESGDDTRQRVKINELDAGSQIVEALAEAKLVSIEQDQTADTPVVQIANEAYLKGWKRLHEWIKEDREFLLWRQQLRLKIAEWEGTNRDQGALLSGVPLEVAANWRERRPDYLNQAEQLFIDESMREAERIERMKQEAVVSQRRTRVWAALAPLLVLMIVATVAFVQYRSQQKFEAERRLIEELARNNQIKAEGYNNSGSLELKNGDYDMALNDFNQAIKIKPDYAEAYLNRASLYVQTDMPEQAIADYSKTIEIKPELPEAYFERAELYSKDERNYAKAIDDFTSAIKRKPDYWHAYLRRGVTYDNMGNHDAAIADYTTLINSSSDQYKPEAHLFRGKAYSKKGERNQEATSDLLAAIASSADPAIRQPAAEWLKFLGYKPPPPQNQAPADPNIFLMYTDAKDGPILDSIANALRKSGYKVQPKELNSGTTNGDLRYYYQEDKVNADKIRSIVAETLAKQFPLINLRLIYLGDRYTFVPRGNIEVWLPSLQKIIQRGPRIQSDAVQRVRSFP